MTSITGRPMWTPAPLQEALVFKDVDVEVSMKDRRRVGSAAQMRGKVAWSGELEFTTGADLPDAVRGLLPRGSGQ